jgi:glutamate 5-kinase
MQIYQKFFSEYGQIIAQVLLTRDDLAERQRFLHSRNTIRTLLDLDVLPVINENDTVVVDEIKFGDNDTLAALVASLTEADLLIILTDIDGLCTADPRTDPSAEVVPLVEEITPGLESLCGYEGSTLGSGGMRTKIEAARIAVSSGSAMIIANGSLPAVLVRIFEGEEIGTLFLPRKALQSRKQWIAFHRPSQGHIVVDDGAKQALVRNNRSLLPGGVISVDSEFSAGDLVRVLDKSGMEIARGVTNYSSRDIGKIKGLKTSQIERVPGQKFYDEVIHRDNLIIL